MQGNLQAWLAVSNLSSTPSETANPANDHGGARGYARAQDNSRAPTSSTGRSSISQTLDFGNLIGEAMATLQTTIPDDLSRQVHAMARARGVPVQLLVEEALRSLVSPEPFSGEAEALAEMEAFEAEILRDAPWER
jgi:hypothetical protein